jgi:hypothetical protein
MGLFLIGDQQHQGSAFSSTLLQPLAHAPRVKPPPSEQASRAHAPKRMVHFGAQAPSLNLMAGQQAHHTGVSGAQSCVSTEGTAPDNEHVPVHA